MLPAVQPVAETSPHHADQKGQCDKQQDQNSAYSEDQCRHRDRRDYNIKHTPKTKELYRYMAKSARSFIDFIFYYLLMTGQ